MAIANYFYHETTKKYIAIFGSLFNKITVERKDKEGNFVQGMTVPISYGPYQKFLARIQQDPELDRKTAMTLPRMSFEMLNFEYDPSRKLPSINKMTVSGNDDAGRKSYTYSSAPYNISFSLYIMTKNAEDVVQIWEQIAPFFKPEYTFSLKLLDNINSFDVPLVLNGVSTEDLYESDFLTRRSILYTLSFTMKAHYFGPVRDKSVIKFVDARMFTQTSSNAIAEEQITVQPGLTEDGLPTSTANTSIPYDEIFEDDDWGLITMIREFEDE